MTKPKNMILNIAVILAITWVFWAVLLFVFQGEVIFPRGMTHVTALDAPPPGAERLALAIDDGEVHAWFLPGEGCSAQQSCGTILMFHGNGMNIDDWRDEADWLSDLGWNVLLMEFRGYGVADGTPSQAALIEDAKSFIALLADKPECDPDRLVYFGQSIGGALASILAVEHQPAGLVLQTPPASIASMAWGFGFPSFLVRHPFATETALGQLAGLPLLLIEHDADEIISEAQRARLRAVAPHATLLVLRGGHNGLASYAEDQRFQAGVEAFLAQLNRPVE